MNLVVIVFYGILIISVFLIGWTIYEILKIGDERRNEIIQEASTQMFGITIFGLLFEIGQMVYQNLLTDTQYYYNPLTDLLVKSIFFLVLLNISKRKYGG